MTGELPDDWTTANVCHIFKKGDRTIPLNYMPVSLTSAICKGMERLMRRSLVSQLESNHLLASWKHGIRSGKSCLTQLLEYLEELESALDNGNRIDVIGCTWIARERLILFPIVVY